jgi:hypothetical protein
LPATDKEVACLPSRSGDFYLLRILWRTFRASAEGSRYSQSGADTGPEFLGTGLPPGICPVTELPLAPVAASKAGKNVGGIHAPVA